MNEKERLLRLYQLLWEKIKDDEIIISMRFHIRMLRGKMIISIEDMVKLDNHFFSNKPDGELSKAFVQRIIKELENDK